MKRIKILGLVAVLGLAVFTTGATALPPDCTAEGPNLVGMVWSNGEFSNNAPSGTSQSATLYLFNPSGSNVSGFELNLDFPTAGLFLLSTTLPSGAINVGTSPNEFIVGSLTLHPGAYDAVALVEFQFLTIDDTTKDFIAGPISLPTIPGNMALVVDDNVVPMYPIGGIGQPIANLNGPTLDYCSGVANQPPVAITDQAFTDEDVPVTFDIAANDFDPDGTLDLGSIVLGTPTHGGSLVNHGDGTVTFTPAPDFFGIDRFSYRTTDSEGAVSAAVSDTVFVGPVNDPPVAVPENAYTNVDVSVYFDIATNDFDIDSPVDYSSVIFGTPANGGEVYTAGSGVNFFPAPGFSGYDYFSYTIADDDGAVSAAVIDTVFISPVNDPPVVTDIPDQIVAEGWPFVTITLDDFVSDVESPDADIVWTASATTHLTVDITARIVTITAPADWNGAETVTFTATDPQDGFGSNDATFTVTGAVQVAAHQLITALGDAAEDRFGSAVSVAGDWNGDGFDDMIVGAPRAQDPYFGQAYIFFGGPGADDIPDVVFTPCNQCPDSAAWEGPDGYDPAVGDFGSAVAGLGDFNGDGAADVAVGAPGFMGSLPGRIYVFFGGENADALPDLVFLGDPQGNFAQNMGRVVDGTGDWNGDGHRDLLTGTSDTSGVDGEVYIFFGGPTADTTVDVILNGSGGRTGFGGSVSWAGDLNGDTHDDVIVGESRYDGTGYRVGRALVFFGGPGADAQVDVVLEGESDQGFFGSAVAAVGDVDGDGSDDVLVSAPLYRVSSVAYGRAYVFFGGPSLDPAADLVITGIASGGVGQRLGESVVGLGDQNGDGWNDFGIGMRSVKGFVFDQGFQSELAIYFGGPGLDVVADVQIHGAGNTGFAGLSKRVSVGGTFGSNATVFVGASDDDSSGNNAGRVYVVSIHPEIACDSGGPYVGSVATPIAFDGTGSSDAQGQIVSYEWDFGDNIFGTGGIASHIYFAAGVYDAQLAVTSDWGDLLGVTQCATTVSVSGSAPPCATIPADLYAWWPGETGANDVSSALDGTLVNGAGVASGLVNNSLSFDGFDDYVSLDAHQSALNFTGTATFEGWIQSTQSDCGRLLSLHDDFGGTSFSIRVGNLCGGSISGGLIYVTKSQSGLGYQEAYVSTDPSELLDGNFHHIGVVLDGTMTRIYLDGVEKPVTQYGSQFGTYGGLIGLTQARLGAGPELPSLGLQEPFSGLLDEFSIYRRALGAGEVAAIAAAGPAGKCTSVNVAPVFDDLGELTFYQGIPFPPIDLTSLVTDEQPPALLNWEATGADDLLVTITEGIAQIKTLDPSWFGTNIVTFTATDDGGLSGSGDLIVTVNHGFDLLVEIVVEGNDIYYAGTAPGASEEFDPQYDRIITGVEPSLVFDSPSGMENYAYVRHLFHDYSFDIATTYVDGTTFEIPYNRYRPVPLGEFCIYECIWNDVTEQYDCRDDCQYEIEGGKFYSLIWVPGGPLADIMLIEETDEVWLQAETHPPFDPSLQLDNWGFEVSSTNIGPVPITSTLEFNTSFLPNEGINLKLWDATLNNLFDLGPTYEYTYEIPASSAETRSFTLFVGTPGTSGDTDGDGVPDVVDDCPGEDASFFDRDGDGCIDPVIGGRHIEYWADGTFPLEFWIHQDGAPGISDGSDITAIQEGFATWTEDLGTEITVVYMGETPNGTANAFDGIHTVTFSDGEYPFPSGVIAVGLSTSYLEPDYDLGIRPGQIIDTDMIFNPKIPLRTDTSGPSDGTHIKGIVVHEAGHMLGLSHSGVQSSTMFYVLPPDSTAASLEREDRSAMFKAYPKSDNFIGTSHLKGTVTDGLTGEPIAGAIVFVLDLTAGDTLACDFTLPEDGSFHFIGLPDGGYELSIHPLNGSSAIGYLLPDNINGLIKGTANNLFLPEYWNTGDSNHDDPWISSSVFVLAGETAEAHFITNVDQTGPTIIAASPASGASNVSIASAILFRCDEAIDPSSLAGNFNFATDDGGDFLLGIASLVEDGRTLAYVPTVNLEFNTTYLLEVGAGIEDLFGNTMGTDFSMTFTTEVQPDVAMNNLVPRKGVAGSLLVINGAGFSGDQDGNRVTYDQQVWTVLEAAPSQLLVQIPGDVIPSTANVQVERLDSGQPSNELSFTILPPGEEARGLETAVVDIFALPRQVEVSPDGDYVYIATDQGLSYVDVRDPSSPVYGSLNLGTGMTGLDVTPDGNRVYGISGGGGELYRISTGPVAELESLPLNFRPRGILIDPSGQRAYLATDFREIQVLDIIEGSPNFLNQIGALTAPSSNLLGAMATDPAGNFLLALDGAGKLLIFDLNTYELHAEVEVLSAARDVVVGPRGERAYVTDDAGYVSIISLTKFSNVLNIPTGGTLLGAAIDPMGSFLYAVNHQFNNLDVIDLRNGSATYRTISARLPQQTNPVDVALSPGGLYAFVIIESNQRLAINSVGVGPILGSISRRSGPVGTKVVLSGRDFTGGFVSFNGVPAVIERASDTSLTVAVPAEATSGPVMVLGDEPGEVSNAIMFEVLNGSPTGGLHLASAGQPTGLLPLTGVLMAAPNDRLVAVGGEGGEIHLLDVDPNSMNFNQFIGETEFLGGPVDDLAITPDGLTAYAVSSGISALSLYNINPASASFGGLLGQMMLDPGSTPKYLAVSPDGQFVLAADPVENKIHIVDWAEQNVLITAPLVPDTAIGRMAFHPDGLYVYVAGTDVVVVLDMTPGSPGFGGIAGSVNVGNTANDLTFNPDGTRCYVLTGPPAGPGDRALVTFDTSNPISPANLGALSIPSVAAAMEENLVLSPTGDRALLNIRDDGLFLVDLPTGELLNQPDIVSDGALVGFGFSTDGTRVFVAAANGGVVSTFDFNNQQKMEVVWGNGQTGEINQLLSSSLRVRITDPGTGDGLASVPVTFTIDTSGEGFFATDDPEARPTTLTTGTDAFGFADVNWNLGMTPGQQIVDVVALGTTGSPIQFNATAEVDGTNLPFSVVESRFAPPSGATDVAVTTAIQIAFSRAVNMPSLTPANYFLSADDGETALPAVMGFAGGNTTVSLTPIDVLEYDTTYNVVIGANVYSETNEPLTNPQSFIFTTEAAPLAPELTGINPPSAAELATIMISGSGFSPEISQNVVYFGGTQAVVRAAEPDFILTRVPLDVGSGKAPVQVLVDNVPTNILPFVVLEPTLKGADEVVVRVPTGSATRTATVSPDGATIYAVSPEADLVIPIDLENFTTLPSIPVGDMPWAISGHPDGDLVYVANRMSGDVSVIDIDPESPKYLQSISSIEVGVQPVDILVTPEGDRVLVANEESQDLSVIDCDSESASFNFVINRVPIASSAKTVTVTPDGARIYVGTDEGYAVIGSEDWVVRRVGTGSAVKTVTVSPDGALLILVDTGGGVSVFDIAPGSATEDQVVARVPTSSGVKTATVSPDGARLYAVMEVGDIINVFALEVGTSVGASNEPNTRPVFELVLLETLTAGQNPQAVIFDPSGSGRFFVTNAGDNTVTVFDVDHEGVLSGLALTDCPAPNTPLPGVEVDVFSNTTGDLVSSLLTDEFGAYTDTLIAGEYTLTLVTPLGFTVFNEEEPVTVESGETITRDWPLHCEAIVPSQRKMSFWKHQLGVALRGQGNFEIPGPVLCDYLDIIDDHFSNHAMNQVVVYIAPESGECMDKLHVVKDLLNLDGDMDMLAHAKQELLALLFNVASGKLSLLEVISRDGATVSRAITFVDGLIDDFNPDNDETAMKIAKHINKGKMVGAGLIPETTPTIFYSPVATHFHLDQNYPNPFNPQCRIRFGVPMPGHVRLKIFDVSGHLVHTLVDGHLKLGTYTKVWNGTDNRGQPVASGVYFYRMEASTYIQTRKMLLMK